MKYAIVGQDNIIVNVIEYDPSEKYGKYTPPVGFSFVPLPHEHLSIGEDISKPAQVVDAPKTAEEIKMIRAESFKEDLTMIACFNVEKKTNPDLKFEDYIESLNQQKSDIPISPTL